MPRVSTIAFPRSTAINPVKANPIKPDGIPP
jgi:hypothetical protein